MRSLTLLASVCVLLFCAASAQTAWLTGYDYRQEIIVLPSMTSADLTEYPLLVKITDQQNQLFANANSATGADIVFTKADGTTPLAREIEYYSNAGTKELDAWVKTDVSASELTRLYMYYKGADAPNSTDAWNSSYRMVQHLEENPSGAGKPIRDSTANANDGTPVTSMSSGQQVMGKVGGALQFIRSSSNRIDCGNDSSLYPADVTMEAWAKADTRHDWTGIVTNKPSWGTGANLMFRVSALDSIASGINGVYLSTTWAPNTDQWYHVAVTHSSADNKNYLYVDGKLENSFTGALTYAAGPPNTVIGSFYTTGSLAFNGALDEIRISGVARSAEEIAATFKNQNDTGVYQVNSSEQTQGGFLKDYRYRQAITVKAGATAADLADFPALVHITNGANGVFANAASPQGYDVVFTAADGLTKLNHDLETFNKASGSEELAAWVNTPLSKDHDTVIYMYYGGPDLGNPSSSQTWDSHYMMVQHLQEDPGGTGPQMIDSTSHGNDGTVVGTAAGHLQQVAGKIGGALDFDGANVHVNFGNDDTLRPATITMEAWANADVLDKWNGIITNKYTWSDGINLQMGTEQEISALTGSGTNYTYVKTTWNPDEDTWYHLVATYDGADTRLYVNGVLEAVSGQDLGYYPTDQDTLLGRFYTPNTGLLWNGMIDEVRISDTARSLDWIAAQYRLMSDQAAYVTLGAEQFLPEPSSLILLALGSLALLLRRRVNRGTQPSQ